MRALAAQMAELSARLGAVEQRLHYVPPQPQQGAAPPYAPPRAAATNTTPPPPSAAPRRHFDLESRIGGNWLNRIGIIAITLGVGFFLKYAFESEWIGPRGRIGIGLAIGLAFLAAAERLRARGYRSYAHGLAGGGVLIWYLSIYAAHAYYELIGNLAAFLMMAAVTALAVLLAARYDALPIAALGLIGGFLTPVLLASNVDRQAAFFTYITLLDAGVLALAYAKSWRSLNYAAFVATVGVVIGWQSRWYEPEKLIATLFFLTVLFVVFALIAVFNNVAAGRRAKWLDSSLIFGNAALYYGACYALIEPTNLSYRHTLLGLLALALAGGYLALAAAARQRGGARDKLLNYTLIGVAATLVTISIPVQLGENWLSVAWAAEGAVLVWVGLKARERAARWSAIVVFAVAGLHWLIGDEVLFGPGPTALFLNARTMSGAWLIAAFAAAAILYDRLGAAAGDSSEGAAPPIAERRDERALMRLVYGLAANLTLLILLSVEAHDYFMRRNLRLAGELALSVIWAIYAGAALAWGLARGSKPARVAGLALLSLTVIKVFFLDLSSLERFYRIVSFVVLGAILLLVSFLYQRKAAPPRGEDQQVQS